VASYLALLIQEGAEAPGVCYHHLAEFSVVRWDEWIGPLAETMGVEPIYADVSVLEAPSSRLEELAEVFAPMSPRSMHRRLSSGRVGGSWMRTVKRLPILDPLRSKTGDLVFASSPMPDEAEQTFLEIMAGQQEFHSVIRPEWRPPVSQDQSLDRVLTWLKRG